MMFNDRRKERKAMKNAPAKRTVSPENLVPPAESYKVSDNVTVKSPNGGPFERKALRGARQAKMQNLNDAIRSYDGPSKKESKAISRGLKSANSTKKKAN